MTDSIKQIMTNSTPSSNATYKIMGERSDGRLPDKNVKPATETDKKIHMGHIVDSGQYNLRHNHDHADELAFDFKRLAKEKPKEAKKLQEQTLSILDPIYRRMKLKLIRSN
jgi:hypothetical protein